MIDHMGEQEAVQTTLTIGELAEQLQVTTRTIRYYEERGLISPARSEGGQRLYSRRDRGRLKLVLRAKYAGFDLQEAKEVLDLYDALPSDKVEQAQAAKLERMLSRRVAELDAKIAEMTELRADLLEWFGRLNNDANGAD